MSRAGDDVAKVLRGHARGSKAARLQLRRRILPAGREGSAPVQGAQHWSDAQLQAELRLPTRLHCFPPTRGQHVPGRLVCHCACRGRFPVRSHSARRVAHQKHARASSHTQGNCKMQCRVRDVCPASQARLTRRQPETDLREAASSHAQCTSCHQLEEERRVQATHQAGSLVYHR